NSGFDVVTAVDGDEAVEKVFQEHPQCIVLDVVLPKQNGFQLCRKLKSSEASRHIPIILLTSKNTPLDKSWGLRQGADLYMTKPFNTDELVANVRRLVSVDRVPIPGCLTSSRENRPGDSKCRT